MTNNIVLSLVISLTALTVSHPLVYLILTFKMIPSITITYPGSTKDDRVSIAGNFTEWHPKLMVFCTQNNTFEYTVTPSKELNGRLYFKFILGINWFTSSDYASEFDGSGNENNVIVYDVLEADLSEGNGNDQLTESQNNKHTLSSDEILTSSATFTGIGRMKYPTEASTRAIEESYNDPKVTIIDKRVFQAERREKLDATKGSFVKEETTETTHATIEDQPRDTKMVDHSTDPVDKFVVSVKEENNGATDSVAEDLPVNDFNLISHVNEKTNKKPENLKIDPVVSVDEVFVSGNPQSKEFTHSLVSLKKDETQALVTSQSLAADAQYNSIVEARPPSQGSIDSDPDLQNFFMSLIASIIHFFKSFFG